MVKAWWGGRYREGLGDGGAVGVGRDVGGRAQVGGRDADALPAATVGAGRAKRARRWTPSKRPHGR